MNRHLVAWPTCDLRMRGREESPYGYYLAHVILQLGHLMSSMSPSVRHFDLPTLLNIYDKEGPEGEVRLAPDAHRVACLAGLIDRSCSFGKQHYLVLCSRKHAFMERKCNHSRVIEVERMAQ
jgi:hypothetical protein